MKLQEVIAVVESIAPPHRAAAWDRCGVQVASRREDIDCVAVCLDPTPASVRCAVEQGAQLIISHHPLLLQGRLPDKLDAYHEVLRTLFVHDAALYAAHTSLDVSITGGHIPQGAGIHAEAEQLNEEQSADFVPAGSDAAELFQGPVAWLYRELQLRNGVVLDSVSEAACAGNMPAGYGLVGDLPAACSFAELVQSLQNFIDMSTALVCGDMPQRIRRVAYCTGSGSSLAHKAWAHGADIFITGDVKYHSALESPLCMLDVGHHSLEEEMMRRCVSLLESRLSGVSVVFVPSDSPLRNALSYSSQVTKD